MEQADKKIMNDLADDLGPVLEIKGDIFISKDKDQQKVCNFVLAVAEFYNDLRDIQLLVLLTRQGQADISPTNNKLNGQFGGMAIFLERILLGYVHEFLQLLAEHEDILDTQEFKKILGRMPVRPREQFDRLRELASDDDDKLSKALLLLRNNLGFHYAKTKNLSSAYKFAVIDCQSPMYASLGSTMRETRYYFIDLAMQLARHETISGQGYSVDEWHRELDTLFDEMLNVTLNIVYRFIQPTGPIPAKKDHILSLEQLLDNAKQSKKD